MENQKYTKRILFFFTCIVVILIIGFIIQKNSAFLFYGISMYLAYLVFYYFLKKGTIYISKMVHSLLILVLILHLFFGQFLNFYISNSYFDKGLHLFGTFSISILLYEVLQSFVKTNIESKLLQFILIFSVGVTAGVFLEILEFILDVISHGNNQKGLVDTNLDLIFNLIGALLAGLYMIKKIKQK